MTKWPVQKQTHRTAKKQAKHQDATYIHNKVIFVFFGFLFFYFFYMISSMIFPNVELPPWYGQ